MRTLAAAVALTLAALQAPTPASARDAGILYEVWHSSASAAMGKVKAMGGELLTTELVIQSNGALLLDDVYQKYGLSGDIWNAQPAELGFYCLYKKRPGASGVALSLPWYLKDFFPVCAD
jgi:hypothetical protein